MSRSYKKNILVQICYGDNREYYKIRRRMIKNAGRIQLRSLLAQYEPEEVGEKWIEPKIHMRDTWDEPTDGHFGMNMDMFKRHKKLGRYTFRDFYDKEVKYYLKNKHKPIWKNTIHQ